MSYDFVFVGSGLYCAVFCHFALKAGKKCLVVEKRKHWGGNIYTEKWDDGNVDVHLYGPHIFHTNEKWIWDFVSSFVKMRPFYYSPRVKYRGQLYSFPINLLTFSQVLGISDPQQAEKYVKDLQKKDLSGCKNLEEYGIAAMGEKLFDIFIRGYTEKQWNKSCAELPSSILRRIPIRTSCNSDYFDDFYQGLPMNGGYTQLIENLFFSQDSKPDIILNESFDPQKHKGAKIVYSGQIDRFFDFADGKLEYRSLSFEHKILDVADYQGHYVINHADKSNPCTRTTEHKHFSSIVSRSNKTIVSFEKPQDYVGNAEPFYPINDEKNNSLFQKYRERVKGEEKYVFGGRLGSYKYYDMHQVIAQAKTDALKNL